MPYANIILCMAVHNVHLFSNRKTNFTDKGLNQRERASNGSFYRRNKRNEHDTEFGAVSKED